MNKIPRFASVVLLTLAAGLILSSCGNETPTICPIEGYGALEGYVRSSGQGISINIVAIAEEGDHFGVTQFQARSDSTGWYHLDLPSGLYRVEVRPGDLMSTSFKSPDTIRVTPRVIRFDLERCRAEIVISMPAGFEGLSFFMAMEDDDGRVRINERQEDGRLHFVFPAILPGSYTMELDQWRLKEPIFLRRPTAPGYASHLWVDTDRVARFELDYLETHSSISGTASGGCLEEGNRPSLSGFSADSLEVGEMQCDADGSFEWITLIPREVRLLSKIGDTHWWIGGDSFETASVFDLNSGDRITGVDFAVSGFQVRLDGPGNLTVHQPGVLVLDDGGNVVVEAQYYGNPFTVCNLRPGRYYLEVFGFCSEQFWAPQWYGGGNTRADAVAIDLAAGEFRRLEMVLLTGGIIAGELLTSAGELADREALALFTSSGEPLCSDYRNWRHSPDGRFSFPGLADGRYFLAAMVRTVPDELWWYPGTAEFTEATALTIEGAGSVTNLSWELPPEEGDGP